MKRIAWLIAAAVVVVGAAGFAFLHSAAGPGQSAQASTQANSARAAAAAKPAVTPKAASGATPATAKAQAARAVTVTHTYSLSAGGRTRSYQVIGPSGALPANGPIIVMLSGYGSTVAKEITRDQLVPYAATGKAEVVYPVAIGETWNAGGCCGFASAHNVDDMDFLKAMVSKIDRGHSHKIYLIGYSNGARMAYRVACTDPGLFDGYAAVKGVPQPGCTIKQPVTLLQASSVDDPEIPYQPGDKGLEPTPITTLMSQLRAADRCGGSSSVVRAAGFSLTTYACADGTRLASAVWQTGVHSYLRPPVTNPGASPVIWSFLTQTKLERVPS
jgi:polyhydroxybutyrate depolymerase